MFNDLREYIKQVEELGEFRLVEGADWNLEIGAITQLVAVGANPPTLLFDKIKDYEAGYRVLTLPCSTDKRLALILGLPLEASGLGLINIVRDKLNEPLELIPPVEVKGGPILDNVHTGDEIDLFQFPTPKWGELDGGRYIGSGDFVIVRDPDEGWINVSTHRVEIQDKSTATILLEPGQHLGMIREKYWSRGQNCPVAVVCGADPLLTSVAGWRIPWGMSEYDYAGWWKKKPVEVVKGPTTGLPIPSHAEIVLEGEIVPPEVDTRVEGPFGEFTGHYAPAGTAPAFRVKGVLHRNDPIILGVLPYLGPGISTWVGEALSAARIWNALDRIIPGVKGVWCGSEFGVGRSVIISLKQNYGGHAKQAALAALSQHSMCKRYIIVVDDDIDPSNHLEVLQALGNRADPASFEITTGSWASVLDPMLTPEQKRTGDITSSVAIILACKPFHWISEFPIPMKLSPELREKVVKKWGKLL